jgi:tRNA1Val (adenine37-N6)-methyltransferase
MSNTYFQFKQFIIHQDRSVMKVCTDACLFGAWMADGGWSREPGVGSVLDIGTGTGLLSLMLAQKTGALIDAVELDENAAEQAAENFEAAPWKDRLQVIRADARTVHLGRKYDLIISNPPFFENDLKSVDTRRNLALHSEALSLEELLGVIKKHLADDGQFAVLLPYHRKEIFTGLAIDAGYFLAEEVSVKQTPNHPFFRAMLLFSSKKTGEKKNTIVIRREDQYTAVFMDLLKDYYLKL